MKSNKMVTLDEEIIRKLREESNCSALINRLLMEHYEITSGKKKQLVQLKEILLKNYSKKAREVRNEVKILRKVEALCVDVRAIRWLRGQNYRPDILQVSRYKRDRGIRATVQDFITAHELIKKHELIFEKV